MPSAIRHIVSASKKKRKRESSNADRYNRIINNAYIREKTNEIDNLLLILNNNFSFILYELPSFICEVYDAKCAC